MQTDAMLNQLGYMPNEALAGQLERIIKNTQGFDKIGKHIVDLHKALQVEHSYVALSNSNDYFKIKIESPSSELKEAALEKVEHFSNKYKVKLQKVDGKDTYYIIGYSK